MSDKDNRDDYDNYDTRFDYKYPTSSRTSPNRKSGYNGVEYIPSGRGSAGGGAGGARQGSAVRRTPSGQSSSRSVSSRKSYSADSGRNYSQSGQKRPSSARRKVRSQSQSALFMAIIVGVGVLFCAGAFLIMFNFMKPSPVKTTTPSQSSETPVNEPENGGEGQGMPVSDSEITGVIKSISSSGGTVSVIGVENDQTSEIFVNQDTQLRNKYGQAMTLAQFGEGDIIIAEYDSFTKRAQVMRLDPEAWVKSSVKNVEIGSDTTTVKAGNDMLTLSPAAVYLPSGTAAMVKSSDVVTLKGRKTKIMAVVVEKRSGTIELKNKDKIADGTVEVDSDIYKALEETGSLKVSTGEHTVVVKGANIEVFIKEVTVGEGETVVIDLEEAQVKEGLVNLVVNEPDYTVFVNDEQIARSGEPLKLPFGAYKLKLTKEGYTSWEGTVTVNQPSVNVEATLTAEVKMGKVSVYIQSPAGLPASVYIDNALIGTAPVIKANVTYGTHQLTVSYPGYMDASTPIIVEGEVAYNVTIHPLTENNAAPGGTDAANTGGTDAASNIDAPAFDPTQ